MFYDGLRILKQCGRRVFSTSTRSNVNRVLEKQKLYQANDRPVHLKGGSGDRLLYMLTMGITVFGKEIICQYWSYNQSPSICCNVVPKKMYIHFS
ncbi:unnamed protein product [Lampetra fluviatilis]